MRWLSIAIAGKPFRGTEYNIAYRRELFLRNKGFCPLPQPPLRRRRHFHKPDSARRQYRCRTIRGLHSTPPPRQPPSSVFRTRPASMFHRKLRAPPPSLHYEPRRVVAACGHSLRSCLCRHRLALSEVASISAAIIILMMTMDIIVWRKGHARIEIAAHGTRSPVARHHLPSPTMRRTAQSSSRPSKKNTWD